MSDPAARAADVARLFSAPRLKLARETRGLTQTELSQRPDLPSAAAISQFEKADARPSASTVLALADALSFPVGFFETSFSPSSRASDDGQVWDGFGHFRSLRSLTATQRRQSLSASQVVRDVVATLSRHVQLPERDVPHLVVDSDTLEIADLRAAQLRTAWEVPDGPVGDLLQLTERHGVVAARHSITTASVSAYSVPFPERPVLVLHRHGAKKDRDRFSVAHELGHLTMHRPGQALAPKTVEAQAHRFAAEFLMPADQIRDQLPARLDWVRLLALKQTWQVSLGALLKRAKDLDVMSPATYTQAMKTISSRGWRTEEPGDLGTPEAPRLLAAAIQVAGLDTAAVAAETGWPADLVDDVVRASWDSRPRLMI